MSRTYSAKENKQQKHPKVQIEAYIYDPEEPSSGTATIVPTDLELDLFETKAQRKLEFRRLTKAMRKRYA